MTATKIQIIFCYIEGSLKSPSILEWLMYGPALPETVSRDGGDREGLPVISIPRGAFDAG